MTRWSRTEVETLIALYHSEPFLYDTKHEDYHNRAKRDRRLSEIAEKLNEIRGNKLTLIDIKGKIKTLRTQYGAEKQQMAAAEKSRQRLVDDSRQKLVDDKSEAITYEPKLWCYESLKFLDDHMRDKSESFNNFEEFKAKRLNTSTLVKTPVEKPVVVWDNKEEIFANFISAELRQITDSKLQQDTKWRIQLALREGIERQMELNAEGLITEVVVDHSDYFN